MIKSILVTFFFLISIALFSQDTKILITDTNNTKINPENFNFSKDSSDALRLLEGYRDFVYFDNNNNPIFGYGHLVSPNSTSKAEKEEAELLMQMFGYEKKKSSGEIDKVDPTQTLSDKEKKDKIDEVYNQDIEKVLTHMKAEITVPLSQNKIDALILYLFWRGANAKNDEVFEFYELVNGGDDAKVIDFIKNRPKKDQTYLPGNQRRNEMTAVLYEKGIDALQEILYSPVDPKYLK